MTSSRQKHRSSFEARAAKKPKIYHNYNTRYHPALLRLQQNPIAPEETLIEKVKSVAEEMMDIEQPEDRPSLFQRFFAFFQPLDDKKPPASQHYDQDTLLDKINACLRAKKRQQTNGGGHCHGFTLLWLVMRRLKLEKLFQRMIRDIGDSDYDNSSAIANIVTVFLDLILRGQIPEMYLTSEIIQGDVDWITGIPRAVATIDTEAISHTELAHLLQPYSTPDTMLSIVGWHSLSDEVTDEKNSGIIEGHTVGVYFTQQAELFDPNFESGKAKISDNLGTLSQNISHSMRLFDTLDKREYTIDVLRLPSEADSIAETRTMTLY